jgi:hypothetical protein
MGTLAYIESLFYKEPRTWTDFLNMLYNLSISK